MVQKSLATMGDASVGRSIAGFARFVRAEFPLRVQIIRCAGIRID